MKYTLLYLKYIVLIVLLLIMLIGFVLGIILCVIGLLGPLIESTPGFLLLIPVGLVSGFIGFIALDGATYIIDNWKLNV